MGAGRESSATTAVDDACVRSRLEKKGSGRPISGASHRRSDSKEEKAIDFVIALTIKPNLYVA
jgi:hypothetical protein